MWNFIYLNCRERCGDVIPFQLYVRVHTTLAVVKLKPEKIWRDSSVGRALHRCGIDHAFGSCSSKNKNISCFYFTTATVVCIIIIVMINHFFISFCTVQIYDLSYIHLHSSSCTGILWTQNVTGPRWLDISVGRALHQYCRSHGFKSLSGLIMYNSATDNSFSSFR